MRARRITIDGIGVDGGGIDCFRCRWNLGCRFAFQHGNAAITLWIAGDVVIRNCDIRNAFFGMIQSLNVWVNLVEDADYW